jgi:hypothetical protein
MSNFDIAFTSVVLEDDPPVATGVIQIGAHRESFHSVLGFWSVEIYRTNWINALRRVLSGADVSCLLTSVPNPATANLFTTWPLYRSNDQVSVQNQLIFADELDRAFDPDVPWQYIGPRTTVDEEGSRISEWRILCTDIEEFVLKSAP